MRRHYVNRYAGGATAAAVTLAVAAALAGCSSSDDPTPSPSGRATAPYVTYPSADELRDKATKAGLACSSWSGVTKGANGEESTSCADEGSSTVVTVYPHPEEVLSKATAAEAGLDSLNGILVGPNWFIVGPDVDLDTIMPTVGGTFGVVDISTLPAA